MIETADKLFPGNAKPFFFAQNKLLNAERDKSPLQLGQIDANQPFHVFGF